MVRGAAEAEDGAEDGAGDGSGCRTPPYSRLNASALCPPTAGSFRGSAAELLPSSRPARP